MKRLLLAGIGMILPFTLLAQTITVASLADSGPGTLRQAIADAVPGGTIVFQNALNFGTVTLTTGELLINKDLTITGPGADRMGINGNDASRVFRVTSGVTVTITDVTVENGRSADGGPEQAGEDGGGILNEGVLTLDQVVVSGNRAGDGGDGLFQCGQGGGGGAIMNSNGALKVIASTIVNNRTGDGGDCAAFEGEGEGGGHGGAINNSGPLGTTIILRSTLERNTTGDGGDGNLFGGSGGSGGAIWDTSGGQGTTVESSTISDNQTGAGGQPLGVNGSGGAATYGELTVSSSTIADNTGRLGGGLSSWGSLSSLTLSNTIVAGNLEEGNPAAATSDCRVDGYTSNGHNLFGDGTGCPASGTGDQTITPGDVFTTALGSLQDNGGPTQTHSLLSNSPAIDQGSCTGTDSDQRGYGGSASGPRIADLVGPNADDGCDTGAFELQGTPLDLMVYFKRPVGWAYPHLHYFETTPNIGSTTWPGEPLVHEGCGWYRHHFEGAGMAHMVFNGFGSPQTADLFRASEGWFDGTSDAWSATNPDPPCTDIVKVGPRAFLQGPYQGAELMSRAIQLAGNLPAMQPYRGAEFSGTPLKHNGVESNANLGSGGSVLATDWSMVELRTSTGADTKVAAKAALHIEDGLLIDPVTLGQVEFPGVAPGLYHVVIRHRNYLPVMSKEKVSLSAAATSYDFTDDPLKAFGTNPMTQMTDGSWAMWAGDANFDGNVQALDFNEYIAATTAGASGYELADFNLDTNVQALDFNLYIANTLAGASSQVPE